MSLIFLIGMPGSGKSYWADAIAQQYVIERLEMDKLIEQKAGSNISAIFTQHGEDRFRELEHEVLTDIIKNTQGDAIVSCGGGAPCFFDGVSLMKQAGTVIYLEAGIDTLHQRLQSEAGQRPLLQQPDVAQYLADTLYKRKSIYERAHHILPVENISIANFAEILNSCINRH